MIFNRLGGPSSRGDVLSWGEAIAVSMILLRDSKVLRGFFADCGLGSLNCLYVGRNLTQKAVYVQPAKLSNTSEEHPASYRYQPCLAPSPTSCCPAFD